MTHHQAAAVTITPGGSGGIGTLNVVDFLPNPDDVLEIEFQGVTTQGIDYDFLNASNFALLDGRLDLKQINSFVPSVGQSFDFLTGSQVQFEFNSVSWRNAVSGVALEINYPANPLNGLVGVEFVAPQAVSNLAMISGSWDDPAIWSTDPVPTLSSDVQLNNSAMGTNLLVDVDNSHAFANSVNITAGSSATTTLNIRQNLNLSAPHGVTVNKLGSLTGRGSIVGNTSNPNGKVAPGDPGSLVPATLTIDGSYLQGRSGTYAVDLRGGGVDRLSATDDVSLSGSLEVNVVGSPPAIGQQFTIVETATSLTGAFDSYSAPGIGAYYVKYEPQAAVLVTTNLFNMDLSPDDEVNEADIDEFLLALINPDAYLDLLHASPGTIGDSPGDGDGAVDYDDIAAFEAALADNGVIVSILDMLAVPEPKGWILTLAAAFGMLLCLHCSDRS